jgi:hypothetical protein
MDKKLFRKSMVFAVMILFFGVSVFSAASIDLDNYDNSSIGEIKYGKTALLNNLNDPRFPFDCSLKMPVNMLSYNNVLYNAGYAVQQTQDEGYILTGFTGELSWDNPFPYIFYDILLIKTDVNGNKEWSKTFGFMNISMGYSVLETVDNGYIIGGSSSSSFNDSYALLLKTDEYGNEEWCKIFDGLGLASGTSVRLTKDNGYIMTGATHSKTNSNISYVLLLKTDEYGNEEWSKTFGFMNISGGYHVQQTADEGYIITGVTGDLNSSNYSSSFNYESLLLKTDKYGNEEWSKTFVFEDVSMGYSVLETVDGGYIITGNGISYQNFQFNLFLLKTDKYGNEEWSKTYDNNMMGYSVLETDDNGYIVGGSKSSFSNSYALLLKTDKYGNEEWSKTFDGLGLASGTMVRFTIDNGYIMTGITASLANPNFLFALLLKIDENGNEEWSKNLAAPSTELEIEIGKGGIIVRNIGDEAAYDVRINVDITGCILIGKHVESAVNKLPAGEEIIVGMPSLFMLGFGPIEITATASAYNAEAVSDTVKGFILLFFLILS